MDLRLTRLTARAAVERDSRAARLRAEAEAALDRAEAAAQPPSRAVAR
jgi:hypothetical protein